jgi:hypothetical protein
MEVQTKRRKKAMAEFRQAAGQNSSDTLIARPFGLAFI